MWIGEDADADEARLAEEIANDLFDKEYSIQLLAEGHEPEVFFWHALHGKKHYDTVR